MVTPAECAFYPGKKTRVKLDVVYPPTATGGRIVWTWYQVYTTILIADVRFFGSTFFPFSRASLPCMLSLVCLPYSSTSSSLDPSVVGSLCAGVWAGGWVAGRVGPINVDGFMS